MKLLYFNDFRLGVLKDDKVVDVMDVVRDIPHTGPHNLINGLIEIVTRFGAPAGFKIKFTFTEGIFRLLDNLGYARRRLFDFGLNIARGRTAGRNLAIRSCS